MDVASFRKAMAGAPVKLMPSFDVALDRKIQQRADQFDADAKKDSKTN